MGAARLQQMRQQVRVRPGRRDAAGLRPADLLENLDTADPGQRDPVGMGRHERAAHRIARLEEAASGMGAQEGYQVRIRRADAEVALRQRQPDIEQHCFPVGGTNRLSVGPKLRQGLARRHGRIPFGQAERQPMVPSMRFRAERLKGDRNDLLDHVGIQPHGAARRRAHEHRRRVGFQIFAPILVELRDGPEGAHAPPCPRIDEVVFQDIPEVRHDRFIPLHDVVRRQKTPAGAPGHQAAFKRSPSGASSFGSSMSRTSTLPGRM